MRKSQKVMRILIVDDVPAAHLLYKHALKQDNYEIFDAERGKEALSIIHKTELDLIILDIDLPDISGLEVLEEVRKINKEIPVIILTAYGIKDYVIKAASKGVNFYLVKPVELAFLRKRVEEVLNPDEEKYIQIKSSSRVLLESLSEFEHDENMSANVKELKSQIKEIASKLGDIEKVKKSRKGSFEENFFTKEVVCPVCANDFKGVSYKNKNFKFISRESDFHEVFEGGNPIMYDIWVCPHCYYAAKKEEFSKIKVKEIDKIAGSKSEREKEGKGIDFIKIRDYESSIMSYKLAIMCYEKMDYGTGYIGNLYLKMAWIAREKKKKDDEKKYMKAALENFETAIENEESFAGQLTETGTTYLMGELYRRVENFAKAEEYLKRVLESESGVKEKSIMKMAAAQYEQLKLERTQKEMKTIAKEVVIEFEERKSKFIGYAKPVNSKKEAEEFIDMIKKRHCGATHNVPAYRVIDENREYFKFSDDGEPQNTAGKPVAEILNILDIYNAVVVVTRYFGGIKLGAGGLVRNYAKASKLAVEEAEVIEFRKKKEILLDFNYGKIDEVERVLNMNNCEVVYKNYEERVTYRAVVTDDGESALREINGVLVIAE